MTTSSHDDLTGTYLALFSDSHNVALSSSVSGRRRLRFELLASNFLLQSSVFVCVCVCLSSVLTLGRLWLGFGFALLAFILRAPTSSTIDFRILRELAIIARSVLSPDWRGALCNTTRAAFGERTRTISWLDSSLRERQQ